MSDKDITTATGITKWVFESLRAADPNVVSDLFLWALAVIAALGFITIRVRSERIQRARQGLTAQLSPIGVLGTFMGIAIGLATFDVTDLDKSIPRLLEGLKLAFSTSILGLGGATALKVTEDIVAAVFGPASAAAAAAAASSGGANVVIVDGAGSAIVDDASLLALRMIDEGLSADFAEHRERLDQILEQLQAMQAKSEGGGEGDGPA